MPTRLKVCCIESEDESRLAVALGASALGLVSAMPSGPGVIGEDRIASIAGRVPPGVATFLLTSATSVEEIVAQQRRCRTSTVQVCDRLGEGGHAELKDRLPGVKIVQVVHVVDGDSLDEAVELETPTPSSWTPADPGRRSRSWAGPGACTTGR